MKKRIFPLFLAMMMLVGCLAGLGLTASADAVYVKMVNQDGIWVDGDFSDWEGIEKFPLSVRQADGSFVESADEYVQFAVSPDRIYAHLLVKDDEKTLDGLTRDHLRLGVILPNGEIGLLYTDCDDPTGYGWTFTREDNKTNFPAWWGNGADQYNPFIPNNSSSKNVYDSAAGVVHFELSACLDETMRSQLVAGAELKLCVAYYDGWEINANIYNDCAMKVFGTTEQFFGNGNGINGAVVLGDAPEKVEQEVFTYEATAPIGGPELDIVLGTTDDFATNFWEWEDEPDGLWEAAPKYPMDTFDSKNNVYVKSDTEFVQFKYSYGFLYGRIHAKDPNGKTSALGDNVLVRDNVYVSVVFPDGSNAYYFFGTDANDNAVWLEQGAKVWFDGSKDQAGWIAENMADQNNSMASFYFKDGYVDVEWRINCKDAVRDYTTANSELKVSVGYRDCQQVNVKDYQGGAWAKWGTTDILGLDLSAITGKVTLFDPAFRDTTGMAVVDATAGAENDGYGFDADGNLIVNVKATEGAAAYRVNVFDQWDEATFIGNTWEPSESTMLTVGGLVADTDMAYQVVALNEAGEVIAAYPVVSFVVGVDPEPEIPDGGDKPSDGDNKPSDGDNKPSDEDKPADDQPADEDDTASPDTGVALPVGAMLLLAASSGVALISRKRR